jgi:hypothetical protein
MTGMFNYCTKTEERPLLVQKVQWKNRLSDRSAVAFDTVICNRPWVAGKDGIITRS